MENQILTTSPLQLTICPEDFEGPENTLDRGLPQLGTDFDWTGDFEIDQTTCLKHFVEYYNLTLVSHEPTPDRYYEYYISAIVTGTKENIDNFIWNICDFDPAETTWTVVDNHYVGSYRVHQRPPLSKADAEYLAAAERDRPDLYPPDRGTAYINNESR